MLSLSLDPFSSLPLSLLVSHTFTVHVAFRDKQTVNTFFESHTKQDSSQADYENQNAKHTQVYLGKACR